MSERTLTQGSIDKIYGHAGKLDLLLQGALAMREAMDEQDMVKYERAATSISYLISRKTYNDLNFFKDLYNRRGL